MADYNKTRIRLNKVAQRINKVSYQNLTKEEYRYIKLREKKQSLDKYFYGYNGFYATAPKKSSGGVDWDRLSKRQLDVFTIIDKELKSVTKSINNLVEKYKLNEEAILSKFQQTNSSNYGGNY